MTSRPYPNPYATLIPLRFGDDVRGDAGFADQGADLADLLNPPDAEPRPTPGDAHSPNAGEPALPIVRSQEDAGIFGVERSANVMMLTGRLTPTSPEYAWVNARDGAEFLVGLSGGRHAWVVLSEARQTAKVTSELAEGVDLEGDPLDAAPPIDAHLADRLPPWWRHLASGPSTAGSIDSWFRLGHAMRVARWPHGPPIPALSDDIAGDLRATLVARAEDLQSCLDDIDDIDDIDDPIARAWLAVDILRDLDDLHALATILTVAGDTNAGDVVTEISDRLHSPHDDISALLSHLDAPVPDFERWSHLRAADPTAPWADLLVHAVWARYRKP